MVPMGSVQFDLIPEIREAGINMVHINVYMDISAKVNVVIPFTTKPTVVRTQIPITQGLFMGEVPNYYFKGEAVTQIKEALFQPFYRPFNSTGQT